MPRRTEGGVQGVAAAALLLPALLPATLVAQGWGFEVHRGRWYNGNRADTYEFRTDSHLGGPFTHGVGGAALVHDSLGRHRAFYGMGWEVQGWRGRSGLAPYALAGVMLGLSSDTSSQQIAALWSAGGGLEWRPVSWLALGAEVRYRLEDRGLHGFWASGSGRHEGASAALGVSIGLGTTKKGSATRPPPGSNIPPAESIVMTASDATAVAQAAIAALGTPYLWGGSAENGFDCSGLIRYVYAQRGIGLPRMSRDQARAGTEIPLSVEALRPGDILVFASQPGGTGVTHVGLYVGGLDFIHSARLGVRLSRLEVSDPEGAYWLARWVGARRIIP